ncbi:MAG: hypothetical protein A3F72_21000 [Bacteroidetes bacterium RIFCSPLOWO2_12_FULL_35_15]|nr:MAG: hypothetical protein A3F72_21000 [Bacteroidetes bacterium RIFCSPLOWO2_12_FULL_35_15]
MEIQQQNILLGLPDDKLKLVLGLREIVISSAPELKVILKWGRLTFVNENNLIAFICSCPGHEYIELGFFKGDSLCDTKQLLEGNGNKIRRLKIKSLNKIPSKQIEKWLKEAIKLS